ncbi:MAG TPA: hypothetical protein VEV37_12535 [Bryobacteraceae bacterium]|jgi:hypothetical protein|nr:hypothetical protein [Bryobacteraceae bacterium]
MYADTISGIYDRAPLVPHPNLSDEVNHNIIQSEVEGGVYLRDLQPGAVLAIQTRNRSYTLVNLSEECSLISGHPEFCPEPVRVQVQGCTWGGSMLKAKYVGRGMHLEFIHPVHRTVITSQIVDIQQG